MAEGLRCLSIRQPWAHIILAGIPLVETVEEDGEKTLRTTDKVVLKDVENRSWPTLFRGRIIVHASLRVDPSALMWLKDRGFSPVVIMALFGENIPRGALLGEVDIVDCVQHHDSPWFTGPWGWVLADPKPYPKAIPCQGKQGFFNPKVRVLP